MESNANVLPSYTNFVFLNLNKREAHHFSTREIAERYAKDFEEGTYFIHPVTVNDPDVIRRKLDKEEV